MYDASESKVTKYIPVAVKSAVEVLIFNNLYIKAQQQNYIKHKRS